MPSNILLEWHVVNAKLPTILRHAENWISQVDLLPTKEQALSLFMKGVIDEQEIRGTSFRTADEKDTVRNVYIESVCRWGSKLTHQAAVTDLTVLESFVSRVANPQSLQYVHGLRAIRTGIGFMERRALNCCLQEKRGWTETASESLTAHYKAAERVVIGWPRQRS